MDVDDKSESLTEEDRRQAQLIRTPLGETGSGMVRYGAAMHAYQRGLISVEVLEAYRICCRLDDEDPKAVARAMASRAEEDLSPD